MVDKSQVEVLRYDGIVFPDCLNGDRSIHNIWLKRGRLE